ncbi:MAG: hypothetical protein J1E01_06900 [Acetatifactor sp.]|nr:hypothetical protein [Acetatifactor sp.]
MKTKSGTLRQEAFTQALQGKTIPILTLDNKWYRLLDEGTRKAVKNMENQLNDLLKRQGKLNTEMKEIHKLKKKLMNEIVPLVDEADHMGGSKALDKKIDQNKRLVEECNAKMESYKEELKELPREIDRLNFQLMLITMDCCYDSMKDNTEEIQQIENWVKDIRIELKKRLVRKQQMEQQNLEIYSYMHDVFGADVVNVFDMTYNPEKKHPVKPERKNTGKMGNRGREGAGEITEGEEI